MWSGEGGVKAELWGFPGARPLILHIRPELPRVALGEVTSVTTHRFLSPGWQLGGVLQIERFSKCAMM